MENIQLTQPGRSAFQFPPLKTRNLRLIGLSHVPVEYEMDGCLSLFLCFALIPVHLRAIQRDRVYAVSLPVTTRDSVHLPFLKQVQTIGTWKSGQHSTKDYFPDQRTYQGRLPKNKYS